MSARERVNVSVVIPTRNRWDLARRSTQSALAQRNIEHEILVVDDFSDAPAPAGAFAHERVRLVRADAHRGVAAARNLGASVASGEWLAFLDDDDLWSPDKLHRLVAAADHARAAFAYSSAFVVSEALAPIAVQPAPQPESLADALLERDVMPGGCSNVVVRRAFFVETGGFDEEMSFSADWDLWVRFAHHGSGAADSAPLCAYTHHAGSWVLSGDSAIERDFERMCVKHRAWAETAGVEIDRLGFETYIGVALHRAGFRTRAARRFMRACIRYRDASSLMRAAGALVGVRRNPRSSGAIQPPEWLQGLDDLHVDDCAHEIRS